MRRVCRKVVRVLAVRGVGVFAGALGERRKEKGSDGGATILGRRGGPSLWTVAARWW